jgi:hypothetical protein
MPLVESPQARRSVAERCEGRLAQLVRAHALQAGQISSKSLLRLRLLSSQPSLASSKVDPKLQTTSDTRARDATKRGIPIDCRSADSECRIAGFAERDCWQVEQELIDGCRAGTWKAGLPYLSPDTRSLFQNKIGTVGWHTIFGPLACVGRSD